MYMVKKCLNKKLQRTQTPPRLRPLTLRCDLDPTSRSRMLMSLLSVIVLHLFTRYDVCGYNTLRDVTIYSVLLPLTFICDLKHLSRLLAILLFDVPNVVCRYQL